MNKKQKKVFDEIEAKLNSLLNVVDIDDCSGEVKNHFTHLNKLANFEINQILGKMRELIKN